VRQSIDGLSTAIGRTPFVKQLALDLQLVRNRRDPFPGLEPQNLALFELGRKYTHRWL